MGPVEFADLLNTSRLGRCIKVHRLAPLYSSFQLPIIIVMKIWFRIGAERGGPQSPARHSPAATKARLSSLFTLLALTREGSICEGARISGVRSLPSGRFSGSEPSLAPPTGFSTAAMIKKSPKIERFFAKWAPTSNRQWPTNRCYRKQSIKPCLTGTRTRTSEMSKS
jgi:hypothetical protein